MNDNYTHVVFKIKNVGKVFQRNKSACWESFKDKGLSLKMEEIKSSRRVLKYLELLSTPTGLL